jgi:hypothetical protein
MDRRPRPTTPIWRLRPPYPSCLEAECVDWSECVNWRPQAVQQSACRKHLPLRMHPALQVAPCCTSVKGVSRARGCEKLRDFLYADGRFRVWAMNAVRRAWGHGHRRRACGPLSYQQRGSMPGRRYLLLERRRNVFAAAVGRWDIGRCCGGPRACCCGRCCLGGAAACGPEVSC